MNLRETLKFHELYNKRGGMGVTNLPQCYSRQERQFQT